jgi:transglutaminase-like putative cysteine protease
MEDVAARQSHISVERYFEISLLLMLATSFATVTTTGKLDFPSVLAVFSALLLKLWGYRRETEFSISPRTVTRIAIFYIFFYGLDFAIFSAGPSLLDRMLTATVHLVLFTTVVKVFSARTYRDYGYLATLSFLMMLASAVLTVGTTYLACFIVYVLFAISTFISYEIKRATEAAPRPPEGPFRLPNQNRKALEKALITTTVGLALGIVALAAVLFFVIPRYRTGYLTSLGSQAENITGFSESVNLGDIRRILRSSAVVMRIKVEGNPRTFQDVKWRGVALTSFDGHHWYNDNTEQIPLVPAYGQDSDQHFEFTQPVHTRPHSPRLLHYRVLLSPVSTDVLFAAAIPRELTGRFRLVNLDQTDSLHNPQHGYSPIGYDVVSDTGLPSVTELRNASVNYPSDIRLVYLGLPNPDLKIQELAIQTTTGATNAYDRAVATQNYLRNNFSYTLDPSAIEPGDPIGSFLFKAKSGYCEYFAAAMVVMLRTIGVPARLVNGFRTGSYNRVGRDFVVRARDAHSWVEVYFPLYGWVPFDPTPADPNPIPAGGPLDDYVDAANVFWNEWIINYDFTHQVELARTIDQNSRQFQQGFQKAFRRFQHRGVRLAYGVEGWLMSHKLVMLLLMAAILGGLVAVEKTGSLAELKFLWRWKSRSSDTSLSPREATLSYNRFLNVLKKRGFRKSPSLTPREFAFSFVGSRLSSSVLEFTRLYNELRYGQAPVSLAQLRAVLDEVTKKSKQ